MFKKKLFYFGVDLGILIKMFRKGILTIIKLNELN